MAIEVPRDQLTFSFSRSGGPGGQHVNKTATKAELRFVLSEAEWIPPDVRTRLATMVRLTTGGELLITSDRFRHQARNIEDCIARLTRLLADAEHPPKPRVQTRVTVAQRRERLHDKRVRGKVKQQRRWRAGREDPF